MTADWAHHDSHRLEYRQPFGAVPAGTSVRLQLDVKADCPVTRVSVRLFNRGQEKVVPAKPVPGEQVPSLKWLRFEAKVDTPQHPGLLWYYFQIECEGEIYYYCNNPAGQGGPGTLQKTPGRAYQLTVYHPDFSTPRWLRGAVMYQVFVDRFHRTAPPNPDDYQQPAYLHKNWYDCPCFEDIGVYSPKLANDFFGGDLQGLIEKLPYLKKLGIEVLYLNPIFDSRSNHKYDTADYKRIDPAFGDEELLAEFCRKAGELDINIILDGVFSHTGSDSLYFNKEGTYPVVGAYQSKDSPYYGWYRFRHWPDDYDCWWGIKTLPNVNELEPSYLDFILEAEDSVVRHWMQKGARGWRLDVVDELPDEFLKRFRQVVKDEDPEAAVIGEVWEDASNKVSYGVQREFFWGQELDSCMNYPFRAALISFLLNRNLETGEPYDAASLHRSLMSLRENYPLSAFYACMNLLGSHDVPRILTILGEAPPEHTLSRSEQARFRLSPEQRELAIRRLKLAVLLQMTLPGAPCIYYGDEAGLEGYSDPFNRRAYPWGREDKELLKYYIAMISLRRSYPCLRTGDWISPGLGGDIYAFIRKVSGGKDIFGNPADDDFALIVVNRNRSQPVPFRLDLKPWTDARRLVEARTDKKVDLVDGCFQVELAPLQGRLFVQHP